MIRAVKKENNKVILLLSQKVEPFIIKSAFVLTLDRRPGKFCFLQVMLLWKLPQKCLLLDPLNLWVRQ